ncbi:MAG: hypothetical protein E7469_05700 [Ruminococcaceae bacterium]|nr:hypothetical protein [Oscillospiraceae bacterium]
MGFFIFWKGHDKTLLLCYNTYINIHHLQEVTCLQIKHMTATFGRLDAAQLELQPGLNIIHAPNESGKSTWCHFIRTMFYGLPTRDRGPLADKNRFAPWDGTAMSGRMEFSAKGQDFTVIRRTQRAAAPMGEFSCTYSGTADPVPNINGLNFGEALLGVGRDVFVRSAFIGQSGLALDKDAELERRISALVTSGEEEVSFTETNERLKKQLNRRRHNKTGLIPALEQEIAQLSATLQQLQSLHQQEEAARQQLAQYERQVDELQQRLAQWEALERQDALRTYLQAQETARTAAEYAQTLQQADAALPDAAGLARMNGMADALDQTLERAKEAGEAALARQAEADEAQAVWQAHPLYPADEGQLTDRLEGIQTAARKFSVWMALLALAAGGGAGYGAWHFLQQLPTALGVGVGVCALILIIYNSIRLHRNKVAAAQAEAERQQFAEEMNAYLQLQQQCELAKDEAQNATAAAHGLHRSCREGLLQLLSLVQPFSPEAANLTNVRGALEQGMLRRQKLDRAQQTAKEARLRCQLLHQHLPQGPLPDPDELLPRPTTGRAQVQEALPRAMANVQATRSQLDMLGGQIRAMGDRDTLESRLAGKQAELSRLQGEYDAIAMAMDALSRADQTLQNRFSPELGQRAAEIFGELTGGRYQQVLFDRSFALSAAPTSDPSPRDIRLLSQGAADQLYLATRLAICEMVLPADKAVPLILDDALANFDQARMAAALDWLTEAAKDRQILLFTCHTRESEYLSGRSGVACMSL